MFKRQWFGFGRLISDEGFTLSTPHKSVNYKDYRGTFQFSFEDRILVPRPFQIAGDPISLSQLETDEIVDRIVRGFESQGRVVQVYPKPSKR